MTRHKGFTGTPGRHSKATRGAAERVAVEKHHMPGTFAIVPAAAVRDRRLGKITPRDVLAELCRYRNATDFRCCPSLDRVASDLGINRRQVQKHITKLIECEQLVAVSRVRRGGGWSSNQYWILFPPVPAPQIAPPDDGEEDGGHHPTGLQAKAPDGALVASGNDASLDDATPDASTTLAPVSDPTLRPTATQRDASLKDIAMRPCATHKHLNVEHLNLEQLSSEEAPPGAPPVGQAHVGDGAASADAEPEVDAQHDARQGEPLPRIRPKRMASRPKDPVGDVLRWIAGVTGAHVGNLWLYAMQWHETLTAAGYADQEAQQAIAEQGRLLEAFNERENLIDKMTYEIGALAHVNKTMRGEAA